MSAPNARYALKEEDRPAQVRMKAADYLAKKSEETIHLEVARWLDLKLPKTWRWFHPPNGGFRKKATAGKFKAMGLKPGVADIIILRPDEPDIWIELKAFAGTLSLAQRQWRDWMKAAGRPYFVARSVKDVEAIIAEHVKQRLAA